MDKHNVQTKEFSPNCKIKVTNGVASFQYLNYFYASPTRRQTLKIFPELKTEECNLQLKGILPDFKNKVTNGVASFQYLIFLRFTYS